MQIKISQGFLFAVISQNVTKIKPNWLCFVLWSDTSPEFLQGALLIGEEEAQQSLPLQKDEYGRYQKAEQGNQDCHSNGHTVS